MPKPKVGGIFSESAFFDVFGVPELKFELSLAQKNWFNWEQI
jgi:hypothetical protein